MIRQLLPGLLAGAALERFLPPLPREGAAAALQRRAALASTLLAGLELSRDGAAILEQQEAFGEIHLVPRALRYPASAAKDAAVA